MSVPPIEDRRLQAIWIVSVAYLVFAGIDTCAKWLVLSGLPVTEVVFARYLGHFALVLVFSMPLSMALLRTRHLGLECLRGGALFLSTSLNFWALLHLPLTTTMAIFFTTPMIVCLLSIPLLGEQVGPRRWAAIGLSFVGVLIVTRPFTGEAHWAAILSMGAATCAALYFVLTRMLAGRDSVATQQFYAAGVAMLGTAPLAFFGWVWPEGLLNWTLFGLIGVFGWLGHQLLTAAYRFAPASTLAPFLYIEIVYMTASSWLIFGQPPDQWVIAGASVVVACGLYLWMRERQIAAQI